MNASELLLQLQHLIDTYGDRRVADMNGRPLIALGCIVTDEDDPFTLIVEPSPVPQTHRPVTAHNQT